MDKKALAKSTGIIGIGTALSRLLGFVRDIIIADRLGTGLGAQAFFVAFRIPNSLRDIVGEGAVNAAIVPVLTEYRASGDEKEFLRVTRVLFNIAFLVLSVLTVLGILFSPFIVRLIAPGFMEDAAKYDLTVHLNRVIFPYLILIGLTAYFMGVLNAMKHFTAPAFGPVLMNVAMITSAVLLCPKIGAMGLAVGVLAGGVLQLAINIPVMIKRGITLSLRGGFRHKAVRRIGILLVPRVMGTAVYQVNIFVDTILASLSWIVGSGGVAALYYANRLIQFPLAIFGIALAQAALPKMSHEYAVNDTERFKETIGFSLRVVFAVMLPASFGLAILGSPIVRILFERGEFTSYSTYITESALFFYSFGLLAYGGVKLLAASFYSMHDTITPVKVASIAMALNVILNLILMWPLKLAGLALATSISSSINFIILYAMLKKKIGAIKSGILNSFLRTLAASILMGVVLKMFMVIFRPLSVLYLGVAIIAGVASFLAGAWLFDIKEVKDCAAWILKKK